LVDAALVLSRGHVVAPATRFFGRTRDLAAIERAFDEGARLVTLWGPAGMGKTRLATEVARAHEQAMPGGAYLCELAQARDTTALASAVARALRVPLGGEDDAALIDRLGEALAARPPSLVVLDNLEQVLAQATQALATWLERAPHVRWIATSRERTRLPDELPIELSPLATEGEGETPPEGLALFVDRVLRARGGGEDPGLAARAAPLVRKLDGIPLVLELAAARFDLLGLEDMLEQLGRRLDLFADARAKTPRQATLRQALDWSWDLLGPIERRALARLSTLKSAFDVRAASAILSGIEGDPIQLVEALRDKSLLRVERVADGGRPARLAPFEGVRDLAEEKLAAMPEDRARAEAEHLAYFVRTGEALLTRFDETGDMAIVDALALELENLNEASERALAAGDATNALRATLVVDLAAVTRGPFGAHLERLDRVLSRAPDVAPALRARGLMARGRARALLGRLAAAEVDLKAAVALAETSNDEALVASATVELGVARHRSSALDDARQLYERALAIVAARGPRRAEGRVLGNLGAIDHDARRFDEAITRYEKAIAILASTPDRRLLGLFSTNLGVLEQERGRNAEARRRYEGALEALRDAGDPRLVAIALGSLGSLHQEEGRFDEAETCHARAVALLRETGDRRSEALGLARLGVARAALDRRDDARTALERGDHLAATIDDPLVVSALDLARGHVEVAEARRARAELREAEASQRLASTAERVARARAGSPSFADRSDDVRAIARLLDRARAALGAPAEDGDGSLLVAPDARFVRPPKGTWQDLRNRVPARRLLMVLLASQRDTPGATVSLDALRESAWPGERMQARAAANRIHVALNQLRNAGLRDAIQRAEGGYRLDPAIVVHHVIAAPIEGST
jgi:predicted ATPase/Tfp pilus assembly protein PilF